MPKNSPSSPTDFHIERANELISLGDILTRREIIRDAAPLLSAAASCRQVNETDVDYYEYKIAHLIFHKLPEGLMHHSRPLGVNCADLTIDVTVDLCGLVLDEVAEQDPFIVLNVDILISGCAIVGDDVKTLKCAWHFDKHEDTPNPKEKSEKQPSKPHVPRKGRSFAIHPLYHFQHGGQRVWDLSDYGEQLLLEPPRIAHPPLDGILAIDFVLSNYLGDEWKLLREQDEIYARLVKESQSRCWRPYALATAALWRDNSLNYPWQAQEIWPQL